MALIAVLWIVAALSLMVIGVTGTVRQQVQAAGAQRDQISGRALGEAAAALVVQQLQVERQRPTGLVDVPVRYGGVEMSVQVAPLDGLISLNGASPELLAALLQVAGGLSAPQAQELAARLVQWRDGQPEVALTADPSARGQARRFEAPEDLLLVPGFGYDLYARIAPLVSADLRGTAQVNPAAAPPGVLVVLAQGNSQGVARYLSQRAASPSGGDASAFNSAFVGTGGTDLYRLSVSVPLDAGKILLLVQDVALSAGASRTAPWRILRTQGQIMPAAG
ncbi:general secretion pathway protein GspK [Ottowia sp.]|uniref:general secretion pathway protein GspK n=1 Tax=Ottowia sp. TaxID=1898956 RepID=UPI0025E9220A|nr:type II secretion system protein GspK [Ottowia sp.]